MSGQPKTRPGILGQSYRRGKDAKLDALVKLAGALMLGESVQQRDEAGYDSFDFVPYRQAAYDMLVLIIGDERLAHNLENRKTRPGQNSALPKPPQSFGIYEPWKVWELALKITEYLGFPCSMNRLAGNILKKLDKRSTPSEPPP